MKSGYLLYVYFLCVYTWSYSGVHGALYPGYKVTSTADTAYGFQAQLALLSAGPYGNDIELLQLEVYYYTPDIVRVKILDPKNQRWEVPNVNILELPTSKPSQLNYVVNFLEDPFGFSVQRVSTKDVIFNTSVPNLNGLIFEDQYLEISTQLPHTPNLYGLGERVHSLRLSTGKTYTLFAKDQGTPVDLNLYGSHPFYLEVRPGGVSHGVFLLNSNAMDVVLQPDFLTYKTIGGILDFFVFLGPTPAAVVQQYQQVVGLPHMPPFWALGWHQCRWGYKDLNDTSTVVANYAKNNLPLDTMWNDIDYMDAYKDFTTDPHNYPTAALRTFVQKLHSTNQHYIMIVDPGIMRTKNYDTYTDLLTSGAYIKNEDGTPLIGKVWPGLVIFPDFLHPNGTTWWFDQIQTFYNTGPEFDGLWIDMNEVSNFCDGQCESVTILISPDKPPYVPGGVNLDEKTVNITALTYLSPEYNTHNLYGWSEGIATKMALEKLQGKRSVVISRSTFPGTGSHNGHWLGDNDSDYEDLYYSIPGTLTMQLFGVNLVGADICGFGGDTTEELCTRWMQLGTFYPFSRNHNAIGARSQEPYAFGPTLLDASRAALERRYSLLYYYYTLFYFASSTGITVWRPLFFEFPNDANTYTLDKQFFVGPALLVSPVLLKGATSVTAYFPSGALWYDWYTGAPQTKTGAVLLQAPISYIPFHIRGGYIIPIQTPALTSAKTRINPFTLLVALDQAGNSAGSLFLDDGETIDTTSPSVNQYNIVNFTLSNAQSVYTLQSAVYGGTYSGISSLAVVNTTFLGVAKVPSQVTVNNVATAFSYDQPTQKLVVANLALQLKSTFVISWKST